MSRQLLPPNRTSLEAALADSLTLTSDPSPIATIWDADSCPTAWLPWLAWSLSVEGWESAISEEQQRQLIRDAVPTHRRKGTPAAVIAALASIGLDARISDSRAAGGTPHAFEIDIDLHDRGIDESTPQRIEALIAEYKNVRSFVPALRIALAGKGKVYVGAAAYLGDELTVYPYTPSEIVVTGIAALGGGTHTIDTLTIWGSN